MSSRLTVSFVTVSMPANAVSMAKALHGVVLAGVSDSRHDQLTVTSDPVNVGQLARSLARMFPGQDVAWTQ